MIANISNMVAEGGNLQEGSVELEYRKPDESEKPRHGGNASKTRRKMRGNLPETTELETDGVRRVWEGQQEEGDETVREHSFRSRRKRREVFARVS